MNLLIVLDSCKHLLLCVLLYICVLANVARSQAKSHLAKSYKIFYEKVFNVAYGTQVNFSF